MWKFRSRLSKSYPYLTKIPSNNKTIVIHSMQFPLCSQCIFVHLYPKPPLPCPLKHFQSHITVQILRPERKWMETATKLKLNSGSTLLHVSCTGNGPSLPGHPSPRIRPDIWRHRVFPHCHRHILANKNLVNNQRDWYGIQQIFQCTLNVEFIAANNRTNWSSSSTLTAISSPSPAQGSKLHFTTAILVTILLLQFILQPQYNITMIAFFQIFSYIPTMQYNHTIVIATTI